MAFLRPTKDLHPSHFEGIFMSQMIRVTREVAQ